MAIQYHFYHLQYKTCFGITYLYCHLMFFRPSSKLEETLVCAWLLKELLMLFSRWSCELPKWRGNDISVTFCYWNNRKGRTCGIFRLFSFFIATPMIRTYGSCRNYVSMQSSYFANFERSWLEVRTKSARSSYGVGSKFVRSWAEVRSKLGRSSFEVELKFVRSWGKVRSKFKRSSFEVGSKFIRSWDKVHSKLGRSSYKVDSKFVRSWTENCQEVNTIAPREVSYAQIDLA